MAIHENLNLRFGGASIVAKWLDILILKRYKKGAVNPLVSR